jgi:hypothetical protein
MKFIKDFFIDHSFFIAIFFVGFLFGALFPTVISFQIDPKINVSDLLSMIVTSVVGVYLAITIAGNQSSSRFEKEFLIGETKKLAEFLGSQKVFTDTRTINSKEAAIAFKDLNILIINLENIIPIATHCTGISTENIRSSFKELRHAITNLPSTTGVITPSVIERQDIIQKNNEFKKHVFRLIMNINSYR